MFYLDTKKMIQKFIIHYDIDHESIDLILKKAIDKKEFHGVSFIDVFSGLVLSSFSCSDKVNMSKVSKSYMDVIKPMFSMFSSLSYDIQKDIEDVMLIDSDTANMFFAFKAKGERLFFIHIFQQGKNINVVKMRIKALGVIRKLENIK